MSVPTLRNILEEHTVRQAVCRIFIGGAQLPKWTNCTYQFAMGEVPTATITVPNLSSLPPAVVEEASVEIWFGFKSGVILLEQLVFGGAVVDSVSSNGHEIIIEAVMDGPRKLTYSYNRRIIYDFISVLAQQAVTDLLDLAGVVNYFVDLVPWIIGTAAPQTIEFSTYGEAINKISEVDGSVWYALPTGQVRVEDRSAIPADQARRIYFSNQLTGPIESQPTEITNVNARPRILDLSKRKFRSEVANFIEIDGAQIIEFGPNGEQNSHQITEQVDGASGQFPNGAYWIPTPPLFQDFTFQNELIDTNAKAFEIAERYFDLKNRLFEDVPLTVPGDPDIFLGMTCKIIDKSYTGINSLYFVKGYQTTIDENNCTTELTLVGGPESGTYGLASPFAEFFWKYKALHNMMPGGQENWSQQDLGPNADLAAKLCEDIPGGTGTEDQGVTWGDGIDQPSVIIGIDGTASEDFDGEIASWDWYWTDPLGPSNSVLTLPNGNNIDYNRHLTGSRITLVIDPSVQSQVELTLVVTDNDGRKGFITKTIYTSADHIDAPGGTDESQNDTNQGGGVVAGDCSGPPPGIPPGTPIPNQGGDTGSGEQPPGECAGMATYYFLAADDYAMGTTDNLTWNDLTKAAAGVLGEFISLGIGVATRSQVPYALFGTTKGEVVLSTDVCVTGNLVFTVPDKGAGDVRIECIHFDTQEMGDPVEGQNFDGLVVYTQGSPGVLSIQQAYQQCLAVGFDPTNAIIAVAIMIAESGLDSSATGFNPGPPASTDRGIAQINNVYHPEVTDACAYATDCAIKAMFNISSGGTDFSPWTTFTGGAYKSHLSEVQDAVGVIGGIGDSGSGTSINTRRLFKVWLGTSDGRIFLSKDSGNTWELWIDFGDGYPILNIGTPPRFNASDSLSLWAFGGDTIDINTLVRIDPAKDKNFVSLFISGLLADAVVTAGPGRHCISTTNDTASILAFDDVVNPPVWSNNDPIGTPDGWIPAIGAPSSVKTLAPGYDGEVLVA